MSRQPDPNTTPGDGTTLARSVWGVALGKALSAPEVVDSAVVVESAGFDEVWISNERFHRDMFATLGAVAMRTRRVRLGTFVSDPFTMHPLVSAAAIATVDQLSGGRAAYAVGAGGSGFREMAISATKPLAALESVIRATRELFAGQAVTEVTESFQLRDARLEVLPVGDVPITLASQSPMMLAMGGRCADSVMISTFADPRLFSMALGWARDGAVSAGRPFDPARQVIARIDLALDDDRAAARDRLRGLIGYLLVLLHPHWWFLDVIGVELPAELGAIAAARDYAQMRDKQALIPDALIDAFGWTGDAAEVAAAIGRLEALGVRRFVVLPHTVPGGYERAIRGLAELLADRRADS